MARLPLHPARCGRVQPSQSGPGLAATAVPVLCALLLASLACHESCGPSSPPKIASFTATPGIITRGRSAILAARFDYGSASVNPGGASLASGAPLPVRPAADTTYVLTVKDGLGRATRRTVAVQVSAPALAPVVNGPSLVLAGEPCSASVQPAPDCTYEWSLDQGESPTTGPGGSTISFTPSATGPRSLPCTAVNRAGERSAPATLAFQVLDGASVQSFTAFPTVITRGDSAALHADFTGAAGLVLPDGFSLASGDTREVRPTVTTRYSLQVDGAGPAPEALVTVVAPPAAGAVSAPRNVAPGQTGLAASVPEQPGCTCTWTLTGDGAIAPGAVGRAITFDAGAAGTLTLACRVRNAAGASLDLAPASVTVGPTIDRLDATPAVIPAGASSTLAFEFAGGTGVLSTPGAVPETVVPGVPLTRTPDRTTEYTLVVTDEGGRQASAKARVVVVPPGAPAISDFSASQSIIVRGASTTLRFAFRGASARIDPGVGPIDPARPVEVSPTVDTTYLLGMAKIKGQVKTLLDIDRVVAPDHLASLPQ